MVLGAKNRLSGSDSGGDGIAPHKSIGAVNCCLVFIAVRGRSQVFGMIMIYGAERLAMLIKKLSVHMRFKDVIRLVKQKTHTPINYFIN